jgi:alpha-tubulin suppressor-like RCC1 family protein
MNWAMATAYEYALCVKTDGSLWTWGAFRNTQLNDWSATPWLSPVRVGSDSDWAHVTVGTYYSFGLKTAGSLWAWGYNNNGQMSERVDRDGNQPCNRIFNTGVCLSGIRSAGRVPGIRSES